MFHKLQHSFFCFLFLKVISSSFSKGQRSKTPGSHSSVLEWRFSGCSAIFSKTIQWFVRLEMDGMPKSQIFVQFRPFRTLPPRPISDGLFPMEALLSFDAGHRIRARRPSLYVNDSRARSKWEYEISWKLWLSWTKY